MIPISFILAAPFIATQQPSTASFGSFLIEGYDTLVLDIKGLHSEVKGHAFALHLRDRGIDLAGQNAVIDAIPGQGKDYVLTSAVLSGPAAINQDSRKASDYAIEFAKANNLPVPAVPKNRSQTNLTTDTLTYKGDASQGTITLPNPFALNSQSHTEGQITRNRTIRMTLFGRLTARYPERVDQTADQTVEVHGISGVVNFLSNPKDINSLRTASMVGPITMHVLRSTVTSGKPDPKTDVNSSADRLDIDFSGPVHTMTLTGNVVVSGSSDLYSGSTKATKAVLVFGPYGNVTRIEMTGAPTETQIKPRPIKGGGR